MHKKVLIIDDDPDFTTSIQDILEAGNYDVISAPDGKEGVILAKKEKPDLILLDVMMEDAGSGLDTAKYLRDDSNTSNIPVIILTGIRKADQLLSSYAAGEKWPNIKDTMEKPVDPDVFIKKIKNILD